MKKLKALSIVTFSSLLDFAGGTILFCQGNEFKTAFITNFYNYSFSTTVVELWCVGLLRISVNLGLVVGVCLNMDSNLTRIKVHKTVTTYAAAVSGMITVVKLLAVSDNHEFLHSVQCWGVIVWTLCGSVLFCLQWRIVGAVRIARISGHTVNCEESETRPLLNEKNGQEKSRDLDDSTAEEGTSKKSRGTLLRLLGIIIPDWPLILTGGIFLVVASTADIFIPFYTGKVVDGIVIDKSEVEFTHAIITMALISVGSAIAAGIRGGCLFLSHRKRNIRIRNQLFSAIVKQEIGFFDTVQTGDVTSRLTSDITTMSDALGLNLNIFMRNLISALGTVVFMVKLSWRLTLVTVVGLPCIMVVSSIYGKYYKKLAEQVQESLAEVNNVAEEACSTMRTVRSFANEEGEAARYAAKLALTYKLYRTQAAMYAVFVWVSRLFELSLTVAVLYYGGQLVITGAISGGRLISFILYQIQLGNCVNDMGNVFTGIMEAAGASEKVFEYIDREPHIAPSGSHAPAEIQGEIAFQNVHFSYPSRPEVSVLKDLSFIVKPGEVVALVGPSGGGKTSCVNLLQYFYAADSGQVLLDNVPVQKYDHHFLHKQMSLVGQEPVLYARSIEENICYGIEGESWTHEAVETAARLANAHNFVCDLKDGYKTQTGEKGLQISGGQKQRIAIARALIRKPKVLLLDEATSALDSESEYLVQQALYQNLSGRTVIIIAHRLSTVERADRIIVIDKGTVVEQGTHQQLLERKGMYTSLVKRQLLDFENSAIDVQLR